MAKYQLTGRPPTMAVFSANWAGQGYLHTPDFWVGGPIVLDLAGWSAAGNPNSNAIYNAAGQYVLNIPVLKVLSVGSGVLGWTVGDFCAMIPIATNQGSFEGQGGATPFDPFWGVDKSFVPVGSTKDYYIIGVKVAAMSDQTGGGGSGGGTGPQPPIYGQQPPVTGNGGSSNYYNQYPYYGSAPVTYVAPPIADPLTGLLPIIISGSQQAAQQTAALAAARQQRQDELAARQEQLDAQRRQRQDELDRLDDQREQAREDAAAQQRALDLQAKRQQIAEDAAQRKQDAADRRLEKLQARADRRAARLAAIQRGTLSGNDFLT